MAGAEEGPDRESAHAIIVPPKEGALSNIHKTNTPTVTIKEHPNPAQRSLYVQRRGGGCGPELVSCHYLFMCLVISGLLYLECSGAYL